MQQQRHEEGEAGLAHHVEEGDGKDLAMSRHVAAIVLVHGNRSHNPASFQTWSGFGVDNSCCVVSRKEGMMTQ